MKTPFLFIIGFFGALITNIIFVILSAVWALLFLFYPNSIKGKSLLETVLKLGPGDMFQAKAGDSGYTIGLLCWPTIFVVLVFYALM